MDIEGYVEKIKGKYGVERHYAGVDIHGNNKKRELAFFAMLDWFFGQDKVPKGIFKKESLTVLDVGCGDMLCL